MENEKLKKYAPDDVITRQGEKSGFLGKLILGKAAIYKNYGTENEFLVGILAEGSFFGEVEFFNGSESRVSVVAVTDTVVLTVGKSEVAEFIRSNTNNAIDIMTNMSKQIRLLDRHMSQLTEELDQAIAASGKKLDVNGLRMKYKREMEAYGYHFQ